jgi:hypothetical protein
MDVEPLLMQTPFALAASTSQLHISSKRRTGVQFPNSKVNTVVISIGKAVD